MIRFLACAVTSISLRLSRFGKFSCLLVSNLEAVAEAAVTRTGMSPGSGILMARKRLITSPEKTKQQISRRESRAVSARSSYEEGLHPILQLHRTSGNRYVAQLIQAKRLTPGGKIIGFQRKPTVGGAYNQHGKKGDPAARQIVNAPAKLLALQPQTGKGGNAKPPWMSPNSQEPLPGVPAPGYEAPKYLRPWAPISIPPMQDAHIYTEDDREKLRQAMLQREQENRQNVARFLNDYVTAAVQITGAFVAAEMSATAKAAGQGMFVRLLKFALAETAEALLTGGIGIFARPLGKGAVIALKFLADKGAGIAASDINKEDDDALASAEIDKRQEALNKITSQLGKSTGQFVEEMVLGIGGDEANRAYWLGNARAYDLWRFRIAEAFPPAKREGVRSVVAGVLAGHGHTGECRTRMKCWGLQCACDTYDRHEVIVRLTPVEGGANVRRVQINSSSQVLSGELAGASIRMLPTMALYIIVDTTVQGKCSRKADECMPISAPRGVRRSCRICTGLQRRARI